jgi:glycosyltransferase involved in cell wall biosynthesis
MRLGFACIWDIDPRRTWSYTPWDLRAALRRRSDVEVVDLGFRPPVWLRRLLQLASLKRRAGRWVTPWKHLRSWEAAVEYELDRRSRALGCDVVLQIQDLGAISTPFMLYQDFSYDVVVERMQRRSSALREYFPHLDAASVARLRERQVQIYARASRLLTMSEFLRQSLIGTTGIAADKVVTVLPGVSTSGGSEGARYRTPLRRRLLFVGTSFVVKGGDLVLAAFAQLRERFPDMTLTIAGPATWPMTEGPPDGVTFLGRLDPAKLAALYCEHDVMVLPSRLEGFGKVFIEALSYGLPCIGRRAFAMPELIESGKNGDLVESDDPAELARRIEHVLHDENIYRNCDAARLDYQTRFNWDRAASDVVEAAAAVLRSKADATLVASA